MEVLKLMMRNSDLLNAHTFSNDRLPAIHLDHLPKILLCKLMDDFKNDSRCKTYHAGQL